MTFTLDRENNAIEFIKSLLRNIFLSQISLIGFASVLIISITVRLSVRIQVDISVGGARQTQETTPVPSVCLSVRFQFDISLISVWEKQG